MGIGWHYWLDFSWCADQLSVLDRSLDGVKVLEVGTTGFGKYLTEFGATKYSIDRASHPQNDFTGEFSDRFSAEEWNNYFDVVVWLSSIEHNVISHIKPLVKRSMEILKPGRGVFLATIPIARKHAWFAPAKQWNFSVQKARSIFSEKMVDNYDEMEREWEQSEYLRLGCNARFNVEKFPYLVAGVRKEKDGE